MKKILFALLTACCLVSQAQVYNNEWIDYSKTYYKFKVAKDGLYRIPMATLAAAGLNVSVQTFQLWRNGVQVPIYTSQTTGPFSSSTDYIEFWGKANDGKPDKELYRNPNYQLNDKWSLISDTASYFLTVNTGPNLRLQNIPNNVAGNSLPAEPYFMYTAGKYFKDRINKGLFQSAGADLYSSSYDVNEGWTSSDITTTYTILDNTNTLKPTYGTRSYSLTNLFPYAGGPAAKFKIAMAGNSLNQRMFKYVVNTDSVTSGAFANFDYFVDSLNLSSPISPSGTTTVSVTNLTYPAPATDAIVIHKFELTYPRQFNFGGATNFEFSLPASITGNYLVISGFTFGSSVPVLYDLTNGQRYVADISSAPLVKIVLQPSATSRNLVLVSEDASNISTITSLQTRNFTNYNSSANQANYLIITNPILFNGSGGSNPVENYRAYRSSIAGGNYNAKIYIADDLIDQFGFGINKNPAGIRNFIRFARSKFPPKFVFLIGKGVNYMDQRTIEIANNPADLSAIARLNLVPTFGQPASDLLLTADPGSSVMQVPIGRLSAINASEVDLYLTKLKEYELAKKTFSPTLHDKNWMKNVIHIIGTNEVDLDALLSHYMDNYKNIIEDTLFGGKVSTFRKTSATVGIQLTSQDLTNLINGGTSIITYFGHSASNVLDFNLDDPMSYTNQGKYPLFIGLGCDAGDFFEYSNGIRLSALETISEKYVLAPERGTIGFIASTHFGIAYYLDLWNSNAYKRIATTDYGKSIGEIMKKTVDDVFAFTTQDEFFARANAEEIELHGDPAVTINPQPKPDYIIEDPTVLVSPSFVSIADTSFTVRTIVYNNGKAVSGNLVVQTKLQYPDGSSFTHRDTIPAVRYMDSVTVNLHIDPVKSKGINTITVTVDPDNVYDEIFETNNRVIKTVTIYEDEARPVYPYNFAIINRQGIKLTASTANPLAPTKQYRMELDTTEQFNSPFKITKNLTQSGGLLEFDPGITFKDSTVYYWRTALVPTTGDINWHSSSFVYLSNSGLGFNQSHYYQHLKSNLSKIGIDSTSLWSFGNSTSNLTIRNGVFGTAATQAVDFSVYVNGNDYIRSVCGLPNIIVNVFDPYSFIPWVNAQTGQPGQYGSDVVCGDTRIWNFAFTLTDSAKRRSLVNFLDIIPSGFYVVVRNVSGADPNNNYFVDGWKSDTTFFGHNRSIYHSLYKQGFIDADSFYRPRAFVFVYKKDGQNIFTPKSLFSDGIYDKIALSADCPTHDTLGFVTSPLFGPAKAWSQFKWRGTSIDSIYTDAPSVSILGVRSNGSTDVLFDGITPDQQTVDISSVNANTYPYLQLLLRNLDSVYKTPYQLKYWRLTYTPVPEGAVDPHTLFVKKDTLDVAEPLNFKMAFKNISDAPFDSVKIKMIVTDRNNVQHVIPQFKMRKLAVSPDTLQISYTFDTKQLVGSNQLYVEANPDNDQPEQFHFNNFAYTNFYVRGDTLNPLLDVTFDNVHILNHDIVSAKPNILIKLKDEAKWYLLTDTSTAKVQVRYPDGSIHNYNFNTDMKFTPAAGAPTTDNSATINFKPELLTDGEYELLITGKDMSNNPAGTAAYRVLFDIINKPMISNMLNYPNPFTTSTAFVFTLTGSEVPQNIKIQILTITGKVVREITKAELGSLHIGRNITDFKWDGTDQYGQKVANGVYLYRVVTNLNGHSLDKFTQSGDNTDKYFKEGYGKMYFMR